MNKVEEIHAFRKQEQASHEAITHSVAAPRDHASRSGFDDKTAKIISNQLVENVTNPSIKEWLLLDPEPLTEHSGYN